MGGQRRTDHRLESIDMLRGLIMMVMALDHVSAMVGRFHSEEIWAGEWTRYSSTVAFLTRFVTHFCAPGFFFLMGVGITLLANSRIKQGWSAGRISRFLALRGLLLVAVSQTVEAPAWVIAALSNATTGPVEQIPGMGSIHTVFTVLVGLGLSMVLSSIFMRFRSGVWAALAIAALLATALLTPGPENFATSYSFLSSLLLISRWSHENLDFVSGDPLVRHYGARCSLRSLDCEGSALRVWQSPLDRAICVRHGHCPSSWRGLREFSPTP